MKKVKKIRRKGQTILVEYITEDDFTHQVFVPAIVVEEVDNNFVLVDEEELELAIPNGYQWELLIKDVVIPSETIAKALYRNGIRTQIDFTHKPNEVMGAIYESAAPILRMLKISIDESNKEAIHE